MLTLIPLHLFLEQLFKCYFDCSSLDQITSQELSFHPICMYHSTFHTHVFQQMVSITVTGDNIPALTKTF